MTLHILKRYRNEDCLLHLLLPGSSIVQKRISKDKAFQILLMTLPSVILRLGLRVLSILYLLNVCLSKSRRTFIDMSYYKIPLVSHSRSFSPSSTILFLHKTFFSVLWYAIPFIYVRHRPLESMRRKHKNVL